MTDSHYIQAVECMSPRRHIRFEQGLSCGIRAQSKRDKTLAERQIDFAAVTVAFLDPRQPPTRLPFARALILRSPRSKRLEGARPPPTSILRGPLPTAK